MVNGPTLSALKERLTLSSSEADRSERSVRSRTGIFNHFRRNAVDAVISSVDGEIDIFKQDSLTRWKFPQTL